MFKKQVRELKALSVKFIKIAGCLLAPAPRGGQWQTSREARESALHIVCWGLKASLKTFFFFAGDSKPPKKTVYFIFYFLY
jgi:hypothetical protein